MSQKTTAIAEVGERWKLPGPRGWDIASSSRETDLNVASCQDHSTETNDIKQLINEFNGLYEHRLRCLELDTTISGEGLLQVSGYVSDVMSVSSHR